MTPQEIFNMSRDHVLAQGEPAMGPTGTCLYTTPPLQNGKILHCGAYPFLNEEGKKLCIEGDWGDIDIEYQLPNITKHFNLITELQGCHDDAAVNAINLEGTIDNKMFIRVYKEKLQSLATSYHLEAGV